MSGCGTPPASAGEKKADEKDKKPEKVPEEKKPVEKKSPVTEPKEAVKKAPVKEPAKVRRRTIFFFFIDAVTCRPRQRRKSLPSSVPSVASRMPPDTRLIGLATLEGF